MIHPNRLATLSVVKAKKLEFHYRWRSSICVHHRPWHRRSHPEAVEWQFSPTARSIRAVIPLGGNAYAVDGDGLRWTTANDGLSMGDLK